MLQVILAVIPIPHLVSSSKNTLAPTLAVQSLTIGDVTCGGSGTFCIVVEHWYRGGTSRLEPGKWK